MEFGDHADFWEGQWIELQDESGESYHTQIIKNEGRHIYIQCPTNRYAEPMPGKPEQSVDVYFHDQRSGLYTFAATLLEIEGGLAFQSPPWRSVKKTQRRRYFRVPVQVEMDLAAATAKPLEANMHRLHTIDLGGGGVAFLSARTYAKGDKVRGLLHLNSKTNPKPLSFQGMVMNCHSLPDGQCKVAVEFEEMKESVRSEIIKFCLFKQIELRNKLMNYPL